MIVSSQSGGLKAHSGILRPDDVTYLEDKQVFAFNAKVTINKDSIFKVITISRDLNEMHICDFKTLKRERTIELKNKLLSVNRVTSVTHVG